MSFYFFIRAHYNYFVTSTEAVVSSHTNARVHTEVSGIFKITMTLLVLPPSAGMVTNFVVGQELCQLWEQKNPMRGNVLLP